MFICKKCGEVVGPRQSPEKVVLEVRTVEHPVRKNKDEEVIDKGGVGTQIVREESWCSGCAKKAENK